MGKKYTGEVEYKEDNTIVSEDKPKEGHPEECPGKVVEEYKGGHHCPVCGFWRYDQNKGGELA